MLFRDSSLLQLYIYLKGEYYIKSLNLWLLWLCHINQNNLWKFNLGLVQVLLRCWTTHALLWALQGGWNSVKSVHPPSTGIILIFLIQLPRLHHYTNETHVNVFIFIFQMSKSFQRIYRYFDIFKNFIEDLTFMRKLRNSLKELNDIKWSHPSSCTSRTFKRSMPPNRLTRSTSVWTTP